MGKVAVGVIAVLSILVLTLLLVNSRLSSEAELARREATELRWTIKRAEEALVGYREAHERDTESLVSLDKKIMELKAYAASLSDRDAVCLDGADADRLRGLWAD